jgi:hypothetical protein
MVGRAFALAEALAEFDLHTGIFFTLFIVVVVLLWSRKDLKDRQRKILVPVGAVMLVNSTAVSCRYLYL